jgi:aminomethyltransferase
LQKGTDFTGIEHARSLKSAGVPRKLVGFIADDRRVPRHGYALESADGATIGVVTSGTHSPSLDKPIGMGYVNAAYATPGTAIMVVAAGGKKLAATVTKVPFV